jgi:hypothetical protein
MAHDPNDRRESRITANRTTIREWADDHGARPARRMDRTGEVVLVREEGLEEAHDLVEWDEFFQIFDEQDYVVRYYGADAAEPFEVRHREDVFTASDLDDEEFRERLLEGETVESVITETTTVESVIVEEATVESQLVKSDVIDQQVINAELLSQECVSCSLSPEQSMEGGAEREDWFDTTRYLELTPDSKGGDEETTVGDTTVDDETGHQETAVEETTTKEEGANGEPAVKGTEMSTSGDMTAGAAPYRAELEVEEQWTVTREIFERFTVESRLEDTDITETDTIEDHDIDVSGLHRTIAGMGILESDLSPDEVMTHYDIDTEITADDRIHTYFDRARTVEDEVTGRRRLETEITGGELLELDVMHSEDIAAETVADDRTDRMEASSDESGESFGSPTVSDDEVGKTVIDANSGEVGTVMGVDEEQNLLYVEAHPGITDRIKAALNWGSVDDDDYPIKASQIEEITDDEIQLRGSEELQDDEEMH